MSNMNHEALLRVLADGQVHSGVSLGQMLGVSRAAVWKNLNALQELYGVHVNAAHSKGYHLERSIELLDKEHILTMVSRDVPGHLLVQLDVHFLLDSTNTYLLERLHDGPADLMSVCIAEYQSSGRGRRGRKWVAEFGSQICFSVRKRFLSGFASLQGLSLAVGVMIAECLKSHFSLPASLKWPNDIHFEGKKLAGILIELSGEHSGPVDVVVGVGFNFDLSDAEKEQIDQDAVSLKELTSRNVSRNDLAGYLVTSLIVGLEKFERTGFQGFMTAWTEADCLQGKVVEVRGNNRLEGGPFTYKGVAVNGNALLHNAQGIHELAGGELSLRVSNGLSAN